MLWYFTLPLLFGIWVSPFLGIHDSLLWKWLLVAILMLCSGGMWYVNAKKCNAMPLILCNAFVVGMLWGGIHYSTTEFRSKQSSEYVNRLEEKLQKTYLSDNHQSIVNAMLLGDRNALSYEQKTMFRKAGAQHMLALSGMHLSIFVVLINTLVLNRVRFTRWRWPLLIVALSFLWFYAMMVGMPRSLLRACLMSSLFLLGKFSFRPTRGDEILGSCVFLMLLLDPMSAFDVGAQLSVVALVGLTFFYPAINEELISFIEGYERKDRWLRGLLRFFAVSFSAWLFTMPLILYYFHQFQLWQPLVSVVLIPITSVVLYGGVMVITFSLLGAGKLAMIFSDVLDKWMNIQDFCMCSAASLPKSMVELTGVTLWHVIVLYLLFLVLWVSLRFRSHRVLIYCFLLSITILLVFQQMLS